MNKRIKNWLAVMKYHAYVNLHGIIGCPIHEVKRVDKQQDESLHVMCKCGRIYGFEIDKE